MTRGSERAFANHRHHSVPGVPRVRNPVLLHRRSVVKWDIFVVSALVLVSLFCIYPHTIVFQRLLTGYPNLLYSCFLMGTISPMTARTHQDEFCFLPMLLFFLAGLRARVYAISPFRVSIQGSNIMDDTLCQIEQTTQINHPPSVS